jgi:hypothetical protein
MVLRAEYSLGHSEFNGFLYSFVGEEKNGNQVTVLSALTRLGLDPWGEAARLSKLSKEAAISALAAEIANLPEGDWKASESRSIAKRLVARLPAHVLSSAESSQGRSIRDDGPTSGIQRWLLWFAIAAAAAIVVSRLYGD